MKRISTWAGLSIGVLLVLATVGIYLQRWASHLQVKQPASWLPASTMIFEDMPDLHRTEDRWPRTALEQIINEPEVQAFLAKPMGQLPNRSELEKRLAQIKRIDPAHFFLAVTEWSGNGAPKAIAGVRYTGSKEDLDALVDELRKGAQQAWPTGKSDIETYGSEEIETFTTPGFSAALAYSGHWLFIATDSTLLKATLDGYDGKPGPDSLAQLPAFRNSLQHLPAAPDNVIFVRPALLADKLSSLALMLNPTADMRGTESLKKIEAIALALKLDGEVMRDAAYVIEPQPGGAAPLAKDALKLSSTDTIVATSNRLRPLGDVQLPDPKSDRTGVLQLIESYLATFSEKGLGAEQFAQAFGPESGFVLDWPAGAVIPTPLVILDVRDQGLARKFLDTLASLPIAAGINFTHTEEQGIGFYSLPATGIGMFPLQVTMGLTGKCVVGALNMDAVKMAAKRWDANGAGLAASPGYQKAVALVGEPTITFTYLDTKAIFERIYGLFRGVASMGLVPHLSDYVEVAKLPAPETISRHLSPIVASGAVKDGGLLVESVGPVTSTQAIMAAAAIAGAAAIPFVEQQMKGQSVALPSFPGQPSGKPKRIPNPSITPWNSVPSANSSIQAASPAPSVPAPSASASGATP